LAAKTGEVRVTFKEAGFAVLESCVEPKLIERVRRHLSDVKFLNDGVGLSIEWAIGIPDLQKVVFAPRVVEFVGEVLGGDAVLVPNITARRNAQTPWHVDEAFRDRGKCWGASFEDTMFLQVSCYLQESDLEHGGGLDVIPGSHRLTRAEAHGAMIADVVRGLLATKRSVQSGAGSCVAWDGRLLHRSTEWRQKPAEANYAIHWTVCRRDANVDGLLHHLVERGRNTKDTFGVDRRYGAMERFRFEDDAPDVFLSAAARYRFALRSVNREEQT
jgi:phytanoyl-CoA dioxygenase PhyH